MAFLSMIFRNLSFRVYLSLSESPFRVWLIQLREARGDDRYTPKLSQGSGLASRYGRHIRRLGGFSKIGVRARRSAHGGRDHKIHLGACVNFLGIEVHKAGNRIRSIVLDSGCRDYYNHGICPKGVSCGLITYTPYRVQGAVEAY